MLNLKSVHSIQFQDTTAEGPIDISAPSIADFYASATCKFKGPVSVKTNRIRAIRLSDVEFDGRFALQARCKDEIQLLRAKFQDGLDLSECAFDVDISFDGVQLSPNTTVDFRHSILYRRLKLLVPHSDGQFSICIDGTLFHEDVTLGSPLGADRVRLLAPDAPPHIEKSATFLNVDLSECRLLGNDFAQLKFVNAKWAKRWHRSVLYDEVVLRHGQPVPYGNLKETYQILKQSYQQIGDHARAGDFHYGEMEMRRREYGWLRRGICPEVLYWLLSGYGIGYVRAAMMIVLLILGFAGVYWYTDRSAFNEEFLSTIRFSLEVATLQRPHSPTGFSEAGKWMRTIEAILGPIQFALFGLALRMRLKR